jgi:hypothetical protein
MLRGTLLSDGRRDRQLIPVLRWLFNDLSGPAVDLRWANPSLFPDVHGLANRSRAAIDLEPCDVLFVHRDAERESLAVRRAEIIDSLGGELPGVPFVCIVPVRMTEAWFLFDQGAIRTAANNPRGTAALTLPELRAVEDLADPKSALNRALQTATNLKGRHLERFRRELPSAVYRVSELIEDFSPLRALPAFRSFEDDVREAVAAFVSSRTRNG